MATREVDINDPEQLKQILKIARERGVNEDSDDLTPPEIPEIEYDEADSASDVAKKFNKAMLQMHKGFLGYTSKLVQKQEQETSRVTKHSEFQATLAAFKQAHPEMKNPDFLAVMDRYYKENNGDLEKAFESAKAILPSVTGLDEPAPKKKGKTKSDDDLDEDEIQPNSARSEDELPSSKKVTPVKKKSMDEIIDNIAKEVGSSDEFSGLLEELQE